MSPRTGVLFLLFAASAACVISPRAGLTPTDGAAATSDAGGVAPPVPAAVFPSVNPIGQGVSATHLCVVENGSVGPVVCWGRNERGQLGAVTSTPLGSDIPVQVKDVSDVVQLALGDMHSCARRRAGTVMCWGDNGSGQLGSGDSPTTLRTSTARDVQGITDVASISAGAFFTCALRRNGTVACWGSGENGYLGNGNDSDSNVPVAVSGLTDAVALSSGGWSSCAVRSTGNVVCWGLGDLGQLGDGLRTRASTIPVNVANLTDAKAIAVGGYFACATHATGEVSCWGDGKRGELGLPSAVPRLLADISDAVAVAAGYSFACVLGASDKLRCLGTNYGGELGNGSTTPSASPVDVIGGSDVTAFGLTRLGACMMKAGDLLCWGSTGTSGLQPPSLTPNPVPGF